MQVYDQRDKAVTLGAVVGRGGEATVYRISNRPGWLAKIYEPAPRPNYPAKLAWMIGHPPGNPTDHQGHASLAWPAALLYNRRGELAGYLMPHIQKAVPILTVFNPRRRTETLPSFDRRYLYRVARNLAAALSALHASGYVVGDLNESNILVTPSALVTLIDADSFQVQEGEGGQARIHYCPVARLEYTPPELQGKPLAEAVRSPEQDAFSLGVLIFQMLMEGNHPFRAQWLAAGDPPPVEARIAMGGFPYTAAPTCPVRPPRNAPDLALLQPELAELVRRCFVDGHSDPALRPSPSQWERAIAETEKDLVCCPQRHYYASHLRLCPVCRAPRAQARRSAPQSTASGRASGAVPSGQQQAAGPPPSSTTQAAGGWPASSRTRTPGAQTPPSSARPAGGASSQAHSRPPGAQNPPPSSTRPAGGRATSQTHAPASGAAGTASGTQKAGGSWAANSANQARMAWDAWRFWRSQQAQAGGAGLGGQQAHTALRVWQLWQYWQMQRAQAQGGAASQPLSTQPPAGQATGGTHASPPSSQPSRASTGPAAQPSPGSSAAPGPAQAAGTAGRPFSMAGAAQSNPGASQAAASSQVSRGGAHSASSAPRPPWTRPRPAAAQAPRTAFHPAPASPAQPAGVWNWAAPRLYKSLAIGGGLGALAGALPGALLGVASWSAGSTAAWSVLWALGGATAGMLRGWQPGYRMSERIDQFLGWHRVWSFVGLLAGAGLGAFLGIIMGWWAIFPVFIGLFAGAWLGSKVGRWVWQTGNRLGWEHIWAVAAASGAALLGWRIAQWAGASSLGSLANQLASSMGLWIFDHSVSWALAWLALGALGGALGGALAGILADLIARILGLVD